jgi:hypothetical protein
MAITPDWDALLTNLANAATTLLHTQKAREATRPLTADGEMEGAWLAAEDELEQTIFNYLALHRLSDEVTELYEEACHRTRRLGF